MHVPGLKSTLLFCLFILAASHSDAATCADQSRLLERGRELYRSGQYLLSSVHFSVSAAANCDEEITERSWFGYAVALSQLGETEEALKTIAQQGARNTVTPKAAFGLLKTSLTGTGVDALPVSQRERWDLWQTRFDSRVFPNQVKRSSLAQNEQESLLQLHQSLLQSRHKNPLIAGLASAVLPGAGQAYNGSWQAAAVAFLFNSLFIATTLEFAHNDLPAAATASGLVLSVTYLGNIISAIEGAQRVNTNSARPYEEEIKTRLLPELAP